jgi:hypothetical protein
VRRRHLRLPYEPEAALLGALLAGRSIVDLPPGDRLIDAAAHHRVTGYVVRAAVDGRVQLDAEARHRLIATATAARLRADALRRELPAILKVVTTGCGCPPLLVKGPVVAERDYPHRDLRPYSDLDLFLPRAAVPPAARVLASELGYVRQREPWPEYGERHGHHIGMSRAAGAHSLGVDLHWRIGDDPVADRLDYERLSLRREPLVIDPRPASTCWSSPSTSCTSTRSG